MTTALVYGWYGRQNAGDELMAQALRSMFEPRGVKLRFVDAFSERDVAAADAVIMGGGCILQDKPIFEPDALELLATNKRPTFYLGVGFETSIHAVHKQLMRVARVIITRSPSAPAEIPNVHGIPDLAYALPQVDPTAEGQGLLVIPNVETIPLNSDPHWAHLAWERYRDEFSQFIDDLVNETGALPTFLLMCKNDHQDDRWAAHELISRMKNRTTRINIVQGHSDPIGMQALISGFKVVMTQRYHGIVLAQMAGVPHVSVDHHDKLKLAWPRKGVSLAYHSTTKAQLHEAYKLAASSPREQTRIPRETYDRLADAITSIVVQERKARVEPVRGSS
jgi:polysaccharide pyruvyl transferase WcaK-like protein